MNFVVSQESLADALAIVSKGVASASTLPILSGVLIKAQDGVLEFQTSNFTINIRHRIAARVDEPGARQGVRAPVHACGVLPSLLVAPCVHVALPPPAPPGPSEYGAPLYEKGRPKAPCNSWCRRRDLNPHDLLVSH